MALAYDVLRMGGISESELIERCRRGEAEAWEALFGQYYDPVCRFLFQAASDFTREDVEEVCQEVFITVVRNLDSFQGKSQFQTWLYRIAINKARDYREKQHAAKRGGGLAPLPLHVTASDDAPPLDPPTRDPGPDVALLNAEQLDLVSHALEQMEEPCRELIELRYFGDLSYEDIGKSFGLNTKTVSSRLSRCLDRLEGIARKLFSGENSHNSPV